jgi:hypothetical protein
MEREVGTKGKAVVRRRGLEMEGNTKHSGSNRNTTHDGNGKVFSLSIRNIDWAFNRYS